MNCTSCITCIFICAQLFYKQPFQYNHSSHKTLYQYLYHQLFTVNNMTQTVQLHGTCELRHSSVLVRL